MYDPYASFSKRVLSNGLEVNSVFWDRPWIGVKIVVHAGSREDSASLPGLGHFVEHVVSQNIPGREYDQTRAFFDACGGKTHFGSTYYLSTRYGFAVPAQEALFQEALDIFGSMLMGAKIEKDVERERKVIYREFNGRYPFHEKLEWDMAARKSLFKGHRLETWARPIGWPDGFLAATQTDLQAFYDRYYVPANISLVVVGGLPPDQVVAHLEKSPFGASRNGVRTLIPKPAGPFPVPIERFKTVKLSDYLSLKVDQTAYKATWAFPIGFPTQARRIFDKMLNAVLFTEVREKRELAYNIGTEYTNFQDVYEYGINGQITPDATARIDDIVRECISSIPSRRSLFERKLESCKQERLMVDVSGEDLADQSVSELASEHRIITLQEVLDELNEVTFEQMAEAASFLSSERQYTFITQP